MSLASLILLCAPRSAGRCCSAPQRRGQRLRSAPGPLAASAWDAEAAAALDAALSSRPLTLDSSGYFLISVCHETGLIRAQHYCNTINERGLACDPRTGDVIPCSGYAPPPPRTFEGRTAKQVAVAVLESGEALCSRLEHAAYLGRELQRAEAALMSGGEYVQD